MGSSPSERAKSLYLCGFERVCCSNLHFLFCIEKTFAERAVPKKANTDDADRKTPFICLFPTGVETPLRPSGRSLAGLGPDAGTAADHQMDVGLLILPLD